jgi:hypothetical protein
MNSPAGAPRLNTLLAALPDLEWQRVRRNLKPASVPLGEVLHEPGVQLDEVYFPTTAIVSLQYELADGTCAEMAVVGSEGIADRLGVRRESVTDTAGDLQHSGLIRYRRGHITVVDRAGLEARCCECYAVVRQETDRLLPIPDRFAEIAALKAGMSPRPYRLVKSHEHAYIAT